MRTPIFAAVLAVTLTSSANAHAVANGQVYRCPEAHPEKNKGAHLTSAAMYVGELHGQGALHGDIEEVKDGSDTHYGFPEGVPKWLVCSYGGKRIEGTAIDAARVVDGTDWWMPVDSMVDVCDLRIRQAAGPGRGESKWTAAATCKDKEPPYPYMVK